MGSEFPLREVNSMLMPICDNCFGLSEVATRVHWKEVAQLYYEYSKVIEEAADYYTEMM
jgi:hypothetical protein